MVVSKSDLNDRAFNGSEGGGGDGKSFLDSAMNLFMRSNSCFTSTRLAALGVTGFLRKPSISRLACSISLSIALFFSTAEKKNQPPYANKPSAITPLITRTRFRLIHAISELQRFL